MNWADYSRFVGNVFGSLLAAEGVFAFFLEGGFLGLMLFGGNRLGPRLWLFSIFMVVFGAHFSALWILMANSWMQTPQGYEVVEQPGGDDRLLAGRLHAVVHPAPPARVGGVLDGRGGADVQRQRLVPAEEAAHRAGQVEPEGRASGLHPVRDPECRRVRGQHGGRGDEQPAAEAGVDGGAVPERIVRPDVRRGLGGHGHADDQRDLDPVPSQLPRVPGHPRHGPGHRLVRPGPDAADQPRCSRSITS